MNNLSENTYRKIVNSININDYEIETDTGFVDIVAIHETIPYNVFTLKTKEGDVLKCADNHIVFRDDFSEVYAKDISVGDKIITKNGLSEIDSIEDLGYEEEMFDLELGENSNHRYYTNGILSHNTYLAKKIAEQIFGDEKALIRIDMSEYSEKNSVSKLHGTSQGYIGYDDGGILTNAIKQKPYSVVLLDEIEKADDSIFNVFLQVFDEGRLTEANGNIVDCKNCIFIMTSNVGTRRASEFSGSIGFSDETHNRNKEILEKELKKKFNPEFLNRIDQIVYFNDLSDDNLKEIVRLEINNFIKRLHEIKYNLIYDDSVVDFIHKESIKHKDYGARPIIRLIQDNIEDSITDKLLINQYDNDYTFSATCVNDKIIIN